MFNSQNHEIIILYQVSLLILLQKMQQTYDIIDKLQQLSLLKFF